MDPTQNYLHDSANAFNKASQYNYILCVGRSSKTFTINLKCLKDEYTHIMGLDHLKDIEAFTSNDTNIKISAFEEILNKKITYSDISKSHFFTQPLPQTYNSATGSEYTIEDRISVLQDIENILDEAYTGKLYKWDAKSAAIKMPNGKIKHSKIRADYMLAIPSKRNPDEKLYLFLYKATPAKTAKEEKENLYLFSAFADCLDLSRGQERPYTILQEMKENILTSETEVLYTHPAYEKSLSALSQVQSDNIMKVKFDNPIQKNITVNSSGTIAVDQSAPSFFSIIFERLKQTFSNLFKPQDKPDNTPTEKEPQEESKPIEDNSSTAQPISKEMAELMEARDNFVQGNISFDEYNQVFKQYLLTLHEEEMWREAAELFSKQLAECPDDKKRCIFCELNAINDNIKKKFPAPVQRWHSMDEIKEFARQQCQKSQSEKNVTEREDTRSTDEYKR